jgi:hypothetical protein
VTRRDPITAQDRAALRRVVLRACQNKEMRLLVLDALAHPNLASARITGGGSGIILRGPGGVAATHFTVSDRKATLPFRSALRRAGILDR